MRTAFIQSLHQSIKYRTLATALFCAVVVLPACKKDDAPPAVQAVTKVGVQVIELAPMPITSDFSGRVVASESSQVRPQVTGYVDEILFQEGSVVQKGDPLYRINTDSYISAVQANEAAINQANANLATARAALISQEAQAAQAQADLVRIEGLLQIDAISQQSYDRAQTALKTAQAGVNQALANIASSEAAIASATAAFNKSQLDLSRTIITAPISGKTGISAVTTGALVSAGQQTPLLTISKLDPVFVDIPQPSVDVLKLRAALATGEASYGTSQVQIILEDGSSYPEIGTLTMDNAQVDETTGAITLRAVFENPQMVLLPGMFVNAQLRQTLIEEAVLLPEDAIIRTPSGQTQVYVVDDNGVVSLRNVVIASSFDGRWMISQGLVNGDKVVVEGANKIAPEQVVEAYIVNDVATDASAVSNEANHNANNEALGANHTQNAGQNSVLQAKPMSNIDESNKNERSEALDALQDEAMAAAD